MSRIFFAYLAPFGMKRISEGLGVTGVQKIAKKSDIRVGEVTLGAKRRDLMHRNTHGLEF